MNLHLKPRSRINVLQVGCTQPPAPVRAVHRLLAAHHSVAVRGTRGVHARFCYQVRVVVLVWLPPRLVQLRGMNGR